MADSNQHGYISRMYTSVSSCKFYTYFGSTTPFTLPVLLASHIRTDCAWCHLLVGQCCQVFTKCAWCCVLGVMCRPTARSSPNGYSSSSSWSTCKLQFLKTCKAGQPQTNDDHKDDWLLKHVPKTQWLLVVFQTNLCAAVNPPVQVLCQRMASQRAGPLPHDWLGHWKQLQWHSEGDHMSCKLLQTFHPYT